MASRPYARGRHNRRERSIAYGFAIDTSGNTDKSGATIHRWVKEARDEKFRCRSRRESLFRDTPVKTPGAGHVSNVALEALSVSNATLETLATHDPIQDRTHRQ